METRNHQPGRRPGRLEQVARVALCVCLLLACGYGIKRFAEAPDIVGLLNPGVEPTARVEAEGKHLVLSDYRFDLHQPGSMTQAEFTLVNNGSRPVRDVTIFCDFYDRSGEKRGGGRWIVYDTIDPLHEEHYTLQEKRYISHVIDAPSTICRIVDVHSGGPQLAGHQTGKHH